MYFSITISMYQGTKIAFKNALFLVLFFQSAKTTGSNLWALLTHSKIALFWQYFDIFCVVIVIPKIHVRDRFN